MQFDSEPQPSALRLHPSDNVVVVLKTLRKGDPVEAKGPKCRCDIPAGHKVAHCLIPAGSPVLKYGQIIGVAAKTIQPGDHVHVHNVKLARMNFSTDEPDRDPQTSYLQLCSARGETFKGFVRPDGRVGTRNYIGIIPTVGCAATVARLIADRFGGDALTSFPNVDGVVAFAHGTGCGMSDNNFGFSYLQRTIAGYASHPNLGGAILLGLGCEVNQVDRLIDRMGIQTGERLRRLVIQEAGGTESTVDRGVAMVHDMLSIANRDQRKSTPVSKLVIGLECGGSDAYSGITANPSLGAAVDILVDSGGTAILSETTEIFGAEHLLAKRAASNKIKKQLFERIAWWEKYTLSHQDQIDNNPTPGNKAGGLTNIVEKSLGAVAKAGTRPLNFVYEYAEKVERRGLVFMDTPGFDLVSITGMTAGGAHMVCFTTGCGTPVGCKPASVIKLASNSSMFKRLEGDIDIDCGRVLGEDLSIQEMGRIIYDRILATASGLKTKSEGLGYGNYEFVPWQIGAVV